MIARRTLFTVGLVAGLVATLSTEAVAQTRSISILAGATPTAAIAPATQLTVPVLVDLGGAPIASLASLEATVTWSSARLTLDSIRPAGVGSLENKIGPATASFAFYSATAIPTATTIANLYFTATSGTAGSRVQLAATAAGDVAGQSVLSRLQSRSLDVCAAPLSAPWGDASGNGTLDVIDAQQIARFSIGLSVANPSSTGLGDVNGDGTVDIVDAEQLARFLVGSSATAVRLGTSSQVLPDVASVTIGTTSGVGVGQSVQLTGTPEDATGTSLLGCVPLTWSTSDNTRATVDASGVVTGVAVGAATIRATTPNAQSATLDLSVFSPVAVLTLSRDTATIHMSEQLQLTATTLDAGGSVVSSPITYATSDPSVATVSSSGQITAVTVGPAIITATSQGKSATASIQVAPQPDNSLALGEDFSCVLTVAGAAYCWGTNASSQLGDGSNVSHNAPVRVGVPSSVKFTQLTAAGAGACGVTTEASLYCWGNFGRFGTFLNPSLVSGSLHVATASTWGAGVCMLDVNGAASCMGFNGGGRLGNGDTSSKTSFLPVPVSGGLVFQSLSTGLLNNCAVSNGAAYCWGLNAGQALGVGSTALEVPAPAPVVGGLAFGALTAGAGLTCGVSLDGNGWCWGGGFFGGDGTGVTGQTDLTVPTAVVGGVKFKSIDPQPGDAFESPTCGLAVDGTAYCWGANSRGQLGTSVTLPGTCQDGLTNPLFPCTGTPTPVTTTAKFTAVRVSSLHGCGITTAHTVMCWGDNTVGEIGDATNINRPTPALVAGGLRVP